MRAGQLDNNIFGLPGQFLRVSSNVTYHRTWHLSFHFSSCLYIHKKLSVKRGENDALDPSCQASLEAETVNKK